MAFIRSVIRGVGAHLPKRIMTNDDLARLVDTSDEWIHERTGIEQRHIAEEGELTSDLGIAASRQALVRAGIDPIDSRSRRLRHLHAGPDLSRHRRAHPGRSRRHQGRGLRRPGCLLGFRLRPVGGRQFPQDRAIQARDRGRRRDLLAHPRLGGPGHLRAVRRRRGRGGAGGADTARLAARTAASSPPASARTAATKTCSTSTADRARPRPPGTCA